MSYFSWQESYSVNVQEIDNQHKQLIEMVNTLYEAMATNKGKDVQKSIIYDMVDYAVHHFETEEHYMQRVQFPGFAEHRQEHAKFAAKALDLKERIDRESFILTMEIMAFLRKWLNDHILGTDAKYAKHFNDNGIC
jgi:hemerythrin